MEVAKARVLAKRLTHRKEQISVTLRHLQSERSELENNTEWQDVWAHQRRKSLLNYLKRWYDREMNEINRALERVSRNRYGICGSCNGTIEADWLETFPEAEYCRTCQQTLERIGRG